MTTESSSLRTLTRSWTCSICDARVESVYGLRPEIDGSKNAEHAKHIGVLNERHISARSVSG